ncbi:MAG: hypothetical protein QW597_02495 [Thermoplasmataceae archaeon]
MSFDESNLYDLMDACQSIGDTGFGGSGSRDEDILVGYIYGVLSESHDSELIYEAKLIKVYKYGRHNYMIWMGEFESDEETDRKEEPLILPVAVEGPFSDEEVITIISQL